MKRIDKRKFYNKKGLYILEKEYFTTQSYANEVMEDLKNIDIKTVKINGYSNATGQYWSANINDDEYITDDMLACVSRELLEYLYKLSDREFSNEEIIDIARKLKFNK